MSDTRKGESAKSETDIVSVGAKTGSKPMPDNTHTPESWEVRPGPRWAEGSKVTAWLCIVDGEGTEIAYVTSEADARRIVAAVNACKGIPTEALEAGTVAELIRLVRNFMAELDALGFGEDDPINGADCVDGVCRHYDSLVRVLKTIGDDS